MTHLELGAIAVVVGFLMLYAFCWVHADICCRIEEAKEKREARND
jgi:hypothetical protein